MTADESAAAIPPSYGELEGARVTRYDAGALAGRTILFERLGSTNETARAFASRGAPEGTVVVAAAQDAGRGRFGRSWHSPAGAGLYASIVLRPGLARPGLARPGLSGPGLARPGLSGPGLAPRDVQSLTLAAAVAVVEALGSLGAAAEIKWPNDVLLGGKKVSGILTESSILGDELEWAIVGVGVNVRRGAVPDELRERATSIEEGAGVAASPESVLGALLPALARQYAALCEEGPAVILERWRALAPMASGRRVYVSETAADSYEATTRGVTAAGLLVVELDDGSRRTLSSADVTLSQHVPH